LKSQQDETKPVLADKQRTILSCESNGTEYFIDLTDLERRSVILRGEGARCKDCSEIFSNRNLLRGLCKECRKRKKKKVK